MNVIEIAPLIAEKGFLTREDLKSLGISTNKLKKLKKKKKICCVGENMYLPTDSSEYDKIGRELFLESNIEEAERYMRCCYSISPKKPRYCSYMLYLDIFHNKTGNIGAYLEVMLNSGSSEHMKDFNNLCLYLLSFITDLPEPYASLAKNVSKEGTLKSAGKVQSLASLQRFREAQQEMENRGISYNNLFIKLLLQKVCEVQTYIANKIYRNIEEGYFREALNLINYEAKCHPLNTIQSYMKTVLEDIVETQRYHFYPTVYICSTNSLSELLEKRNYKKARDLITSNKTVVNPEKRGPKLLLSLIDFMLSYKEANRYRELYQFNIDPTDFLSKLEKTVEAGSLNQSLYYLSKHLKSKGLEEYYYLMEILVKICIESGGTWEYLWPLDVLTPDYKVPIKYFQDSLKDALRDGNFSIARMFLKIIEETNAHGHADLSPDDIATVLNSCNRMLENYAISGDPNYVIKPVE